MCQSRGGRGRSLRIGVAVLALSLTGLAWCAAESESPPGEAVAETVPPRPEASHAAAPVLIAPPSWRGDLWTRSQLTGDWGGSRDELGERGLTFFGDITQYDQGVAAGGLAQQFRYGVRADYLVDFDTRKLGLWEGGRLDVRGETRLGQDCNGIDGTVAPSNFAMALPRPGESVTALTGVQYTQDLSERVSVFFGKLNLLDGTPGAYVRGMRLNYFWNAAMQSNLSRAYLIPSTPGAGFTVRDDAEPVFNFYLLDSRYTPTSSGISRLFDNGVVAYGEYRARTNWLDRPGHSAVALLYSSATRTALDANPYEVIEAIVSGKPLPTEDTSWTAIYRFDQVVQADADDPRRDWTLNGDLGVTDGNPNPIRWFANVSLVGGSPIRGRENDTIGIGYYHLGVSQLPVLTALGFGAENGVEVFYNAAVTPWFHVTPDLQILDPAQRNNATALLVGIRARLSF